MKKILIIFSVLIIILFSISYFQKSRSNHEEGIEISFRDQKRFLPYSKILSIEKSNFSTKQNHKMNGYDLVKILKALDIPASIETEYSFHSKDGGTLKLIKKQNETFYLLFKEDADGHYLRLIIPSDEFSQRWLKYITSIEIK